MTGERTEINAAAKIAILDEIAAKTRLRVELAKKEMPFEQLKTAALALVQKNRSAGNSATVQAEAASSKAAPAAGPVPFEQALRAPGLSFICEVKKASPSKGVIAKDFPYVEIAKEYEAAGASAISVLTEPDFFLGANRHLKEITGTVKIPVLRKDFIIDPYQIYEAKLLGAASVLLICALLPEKALESFIKISASLDMPALVEIHNEREIEIALTAGARIIGINNRDLRNFTVDPATSTRLRKLIPEDIITVAESGIKSPEDIRALRGMGLDAVLIGESLMRAADKKKFLSELKAASI